jgi:hypothetical protein
MKTNSPRTARTEVLPGTHHEPEEAEIQKTAYALWLEKGCPAGNDLDNWFEARELLLHRARLHATGPKAAPRRNGPSSARPGSNPAPALVHFPASHPEGSTGPAGSGSPSTHLDFRHTPPPFPPSQPS